ncbi:hypothetical protein SAMN05661099_0911 [Daejeonella lutea]|uniref:Uncharacterized protein n=1 Tax=Daejeonella lutea TaxID=572036 RepID=A0A1T5AP25_9SPHI|nr:hypothetical protein SAMN05661099_0911 [Daejeonella lutea]
MWTKLTFLTQTLTNARQGDLVNYRNKKSLPGSREAFVDLYTINLLPV